MGRHAPQSYEEKLRRLQDLRREAAEREQTARAREPLRERGERPPCEKHLRRQPDPGSFHELDSFMRHRTHEFKMQRARPLGDAVITGHGTIDGRPVCVFSQDHTVFGGSLGEVMGEKICKVMDLAERTGCPLIAIDDSGGARIQEGVVSLGAYGEVFMRNVRCSGVIPQISLVMGACAGGAVYSPAIGDFTFMVRGTSHMFITGPEVVRAVTGEEVSFEELGGAKPHSTRSGVAHFACDSDAECLAQCRRLLGFLPSNSGQRPPRAQPSDDPHRADPRLDSVVPDSSRKPYDMRDVVRLVVDGGELLEVSERHARNVLCCFARLDGHAVGIVGNQPRYLAGVLDIDASSKAARFVRTCDAFNVPILTLVDVPGFLPGTDQEWRGIIRHGAKLLYAYAEATVPKITLITRKAYGGAYDAMSSKHLGADFNFAWPTAEIAVMGAEGAVNVIHRREIAASEDPQARREELIDDYAARFANPYTAAERGYVDDVIEPRDTRPRLIAALAALQTKRVAQPARKHGNIPL